MKRKISGSLTVEVVLLFPIIFLILIGMMQCGFHFTYKIWERCLCDQSILLYQELIQEGKDPAEIKDQIQKHLEDRLIGAGLQKVKVKVSEINRILSQEICIETEAQYNFLYKAFITDKITGEYHPQRAIRDTINIIIEAEKKIPGMQKIWNYYQESIEQCMEMVQ